MSSHLEDTLLYQLKVYKLDRRFIQEYVGITDRKYRFDFAGPIKMIAIEIEGGLYQKGGHNSVSGIKRDIEKNNLAVLAGWKLLRFSEDMVNDGRAIEIIRKLYN